MGRGTPGMRPSCRRQHGASTAGLGREGAKFACFVRGLVWNPSSRRKGRELLLETSATSVSTSAHRTEKTTMPAMRLFIDTHDTSRGTFPEGMTEEAFAAFYPKYEQ